MPGAKRHLESLAMNRERQARPSPEPLEPGAPQQSKQLARRNIRLALGLGLLALLLYLGFFLLYGAR